MALVVRVFGVSELPVLQPYLPTIGETLQLIELRARPFRFHVEFWVTRDQISSRRRTTDAAGRSIFHFPYAPPRSGADQIRIGFVQNSIYRVDRIKRGSTTQDLVSIDNRMLDTTLEPDDPFYPFIYEPQPIEVPQSQQQARPLRLARARPGGGVSMMERQDSVDQGHHFSGMNATVHANGRIATNYPLLDPFMRDAPRVSQSATIALRYEDVPTASVPILCQNQRLTEFKIAQIQQFFVVFQLNGGPLEAILATTPFTTFAYAKIIPPAQGRSHVGATIESNVADFFPWPQRIDAIPTREAALQPFHEREFLRYRAARPAAYRPRVEGVQVGLPSDIIASQLDAAMVSSGQSANELLRTLPNPCMDEYQARSQAVIAKRSKAGG
ncbi:hypothetical protein [Poseidonocella sp. HB161398]|uniref:hypothetical protein n=1 Tax=Poseidonocella sp. HB161398 TaxID=2320855 RepID=UPI001107FDDD|nr:hypothetical protein [Poseidonocella sp. HB161398]